MEKAKCDLSDVIKKKRNQPFSFSDLFPILRDTIIGLTAMHLKNIVHRDIKPDNIMKFSKNNFKLSDYGISMNLTYYENYSKNDQY